MNETTATFSDAPPRVKPRSAWIAGLLAGLCPGLGHLYDGSPGAAVVLVFTSPLLLMTALGLGSFSPHWIFRLLLSGIVLALLLWASQIAWACLLARRRGTNHSLAWYNHFVVYVAFYCASQIAVGTTALLFRCWGVESVGIASGSMLPTLRPGDDMLVFKLGPASHWDRGDVIVFYPPDDESSVSPGAFNRQMFAKRVIGKGGDNVEIQGIQVVVNGRAYEQLPCPTPEYSDAVVVGEHETRMSAACGVEMPPWGRSYQILDMSESDLPHHSLAPTLVKPHHVLVIGDNRDNSFDSRSFGQVPEDHVIGRAAVIWLSFSPEKGILWSRMGQEL